MRINVAITSNRLSSGLYSYVTFFNGPNITDMEIKALFFVYARIEINMGLVLLVLFFECYQYIR